MPIPRRLIRTVPASTSDQTEAWWAQAVSLHPGWEHVTLRDPVNRADFPLTAHLWDTCETGAQLGDLIKTEELFWRGGVVIDADYVAFRPFDSLLALDGVVAYEDADYIPNAVMLFKPGHPALSRVIELAIQHHDQGTWAAGVGVTTKVFHDRTDLTLLPPGSFYPVHWREAHKKPIDIERIRVDYPSAWGVHLYHASWHPKTRMHN